MSAATIDQWTERLTIPQDWKGLRFFGLLDAKYDILIKERVTDEGDIHYFTAWVNLGKGKLKEHYEFESDRKGFYIAVDTYEFNKNEKPDSDYAKEFEDGEGFGHGLLVSQVRMIIEEHLEYQKEAK